MFVHADLGSSPPALCLKEPDDLGSLKVVVSGAATARATLAQALEPIGTLDDDNSVSIKIDAVKRLAGDKTREPAWLESFDRMVDYARTRGWVGEDGRTLQAHCEYQGG